MSISKDENTKVTVLETNAQSAINRCSDTNMGSIGDRSRGGDITDIGTNVIRATTSKIITALM